MGKSEYKRPLMGIEEFVPQEYVAGCNKPYPSITTLYPSSNYAHLYLDLTGEGDFTKSSGERFYNGGNTNCGEDRIIKGVDVFYLQQHSQNQWISTTITPQDGVSYQPGVQFDNIYNGHVTAVLKFTKINTYDIKIENHQAYIYTHS